MSLFARIPEWAWWSLSTFSVVAFLGSLVALDMLIVRLPPDYFAREDPPPSRWAGRHPALRISLLIVKNCVGLALFLLGIVMLLTPGQGILSILVGLSLIDLPGKRSVERRLVSNPVVLRTLNAIRQRRGRPALINPGRTADLEPKKEEPQMNTDEH